MLLRVVVARPRLRHWETHVVVARPRLGKHKDVLSLCVPAYDIGGAHRPFYKQKWGSGLFEAGKTLTAAEIVRDLLLNASPPTT